MRYLLGLAAKVAVSIGKGGGVGPPRAVSVPVRAAQTRHWVNQNDKVPQNSNAEMVFNRCLQIAGHLQGSGRNDGTISMSHMGITRGIQLATKTVV